MSCLCRWKWKGGVRGAEGADRGREVHVLTLALLAVQICCLCRWKWKGGVRGAEGGDREGR